MSTAGTSRHRTFLVILARIPTRFPASIAIITLGICLPLLPPPYADSHLPTVTVVGAVATLVGVRYREYRDWSWGENSRPDAVVLLYVLVGAYLIPAYVGIVDALPAVYDPFVVEVANYDPAAVRPVVFSEPYVTLWMPTLLGLAVVVDVLTGTISRSDADASNSSSVQRVGIILWTVAWPVAAVWYFSMAMSLHSTLSPAAGATTLLTVWSFGLLNFVAWRGSTAPLLGSLLNLDLKLATGWLFVYLGHSLPIFIFVATITGVLFTSPEARISGFLLGVDLLAFVAVLVSGYSLLRGIRRLGNWHVLPLFLVFEIFVWVGGATGVLLDSFGRGVLYAYLVGLLPVLGLGVAGAQLAGKRDLSVLGIASFFQAPLYLGLGFHVVNTGIVTSKAGLFANPQLWNDPLWFWTLICFLITHLFVLLGSVWTSAYADVDEDRVSTAGQTTPLSTGDRTVPREISVLKGALDHCVDGGPTAQRYETIEALYTDGHESRAVRLANESSQVARTEMAVVDLVNIVARGLREDDERGLYNRFVRSSHRRVRRGEFVSVLVRAEEHLEIDDTGAIDSSTDGALPIPVDPEELRPALERAREQVTELPRVRVESSGSTQDDERGDRDDESHREDDSGTVGPTTTESAGDSPDPIDVDLPTDGLDIDFTPLERGTATELLATYHGRSGTTDVRLIVAETDDDRVRETFSQTVANWADVDHVEGVQDVLSRGGRPRPWVLTETTPTTLSDLSVDRPVGIRASLIVDVAEILRTVERYNVRHLSLRPECIGVAGTDEALGPVVDDWGLTWQCHDRAGVATPTPYTAPEQIAPDRIGRVGQHTDVYRLGAVTYEVLTNRPLYDPEVTDLDERILAGDVAPPTAIDDDLPSEIDDLLGTALAVDPGDRDLSIAQFREQFRAQFDGQIE